MLKNKNTLAVAAGCIGRQRLLFAAAVVSTLAAVALSLVPPQLLRLIVDRQLLPKRAEGLLGLALLYLLAVVLVGVFDFLKGSLLVILGQKLVKHLRMEMCDKLQRMELQYFSKNSAAELSARFTTDAYHVTALFSDGVAGLMVDCLKIAGAVVSLALFSLPLGAMVLAAIPAVYLLTRLFQKRTLRAQTDNLRQLGRVNDHIAQSLQNAPMIKAFGKEAMMEQRYRDHLQNNFDTLKKVNFYDSCYSPVIQLIRGAVIALAVVLAAGGATATGLTPGVLAASIDLISGLFAPVEALGMELQSIQKGVSGIRRIDRFLAQKEAPAKRQELTAQQVLGGTRRADIRFDQVSFSYEGGQPVLCGIDLWVPAGSSVTFAGRTGVGKTTLLKLIMGLEAPTQGRVTYNGVDVSQIPNGEKRRLYGYVEQNFCFVQGTVAQQISLGDPAIGRDQIRQALEFVGLWDYLQTLEKGMDTPVNAQSAFSQGQRQLLAVARAIAADPPLLLLDEITANLDSATEERLVGVLAKAGGRRTVLSVSHRLSARLCCDRVVLLEEGRIAPQGPLERPAL